MTEAPAGPGQEVELSRGEARLVRVVLGGVSVLALGHLALGALSPPTVHDTALGAVALGASVGWGVRLVLAVAAALCFVLCPGVLLRRWTSGSDLFGNTALLWVPGFLYLVAVGVVCWLLESRVSPQAVSTVLLVPIPLLVLAALVSPGDRHARLHRGEPAVIGVMLLLLAVGVGMSTWSEGVPGELYPGTITRNLQSDNRPDSRIPYNVVMLIAHGDTPYGAKAKLYYTPYNFYSRGPIAGLAAAPVLFAGAAAPPRDLPVNPWEPFDAQGYATYRIVLMLLASTIVLAAYGLLRRFLTARVAWAGAVLVALSPFVVHEVYFTWPKLLAASFGLAAAGAIVTRRPLIGGVLLGLAYLAHPSGLFAIPAVVLGWGVLLWRGAPALGLDAPASMRRRLIRWARDTVWLGVGVLAIYLAWTLANAGHTANYFTSYVLEASGKQGVSVGAWTTYRLHSLADTLVPFETFLADRHSYWMNSFYGPSPNIVRFSASYWLTLPFAFGLLYFPAYLWGLARCARRAPLLLTATLLVPFLAFTVYWGVTDVGMLREGLHFVVVGSLLAAFVGHSVMSPSGRLRALVRWTATARVVEVLFMMLVPTIVTSGVSVSHLFLPTDIVAFTLIVGGALALAALTWRAFDPARLATRPTAAPVSVAAASASARHRSR
ncbi:MAG TPA: hypothetical protein VI462_01815 [Acidimicrobiia bacterium]